MCIDDSVNFNVAPLKIVEPKRYKNESIFWSTSYGIRCFAKPKEFTRMCYQKMQSATLGNTHYLITDFNYVI